MPAPALQRIAQGAGDTPSAYIVRYNSAAVGCHAGLLKL
jgi:hypothetical protein